MQKSYDCSIKNLRPFFGNQVLTDVSPKLIADYKRMRLEKGRRPATVNRELNCLSKAFNLAVKEWEWLNENPCSKVSKEKENNLRERWLTRAEEEKLLAACPDWLREVVIIALQTGMRQGVTHVFPSDTGTMLDAANVRRAFRATVKEAKIQNFRFHDLRHTMASRMAQSGVAKILGHKTLSMVMGDAHHRAGLKRRSGLRQMVEKW